MTKKQDYLNVEELKLRGWNWHSIRYLLSDEPLEIALNGHRYFLKSFIERIEGQHWLYFRSKKKKAIERYIEHKPTVRQF